MVIFGLNSTVLVCPATIFRWIEANENISVASSSYQFTRYNARAQNLLVYDVLPPYQIIGQIYILRQILTINFSQENMRYLS
jgi:hypothetical protein